MFVEQISIPEDYRLTADFSWHPDGDWLLLTWESASYSDSLCGYYIWYVENTTLSSNYELSNDCGNLAAHTLSPDGTRLALSLFSYDSYSGKAAMYDLINNSVEFEIDDYYPSYLSFSHDGSSLIGLTNSYILVWDSFDGYFLDSKSIGSRYSMIISPDSDFIYTWNDDNIKVYSLQSLALISLTSVSNEWSDDTSIADISFSRSNDLLYVSQSNITFFEDSYIINSSIQTYQISSTQSLEFVTETDTINDEFRRAIVSPNENSILIQMYGGENSGIFMWESDSDGDKISDLSDVCQHTELDETSDETGCSWGQKDDDEDNILNNLDVCMGTMNGKIVDELGCSDSQVDEDLDGICDKNAPSVGPSDCFGVDICSDTLPGKNVNSMGCSWEQEDDDFDSVPNGIDICPETVYGDNPNEVGCGDKQRDSDEDSLNDYWDLCASTEINASVDASGCSDFQVDTDSDTVCNMGAASFGPSNCTGIDRCPNTMSNKSVDVNGRSWEQRDDDGDGVLNLHDSCPDTLNSDISPDGCSSWQRDADNDGVADALDECAKTPSDEFSNQVGCSESQETTNANAQGNDKLSTIQWILIGSVFMVVVALAGVLLKREKPQKNITLSESIVPPYEVRGMMKTDGKEWIEYPNGSGKLFYRDPATGQWVNSK